MKLSGGGSNIGWSQLIMAAVGTRPLWKCHERSSLGMAASNELAACKNVGKLSSTPDKGLWQDTDFSASIHSHDSVALEF